MALMPVADALAAVLAGSGALAREHVAIDEAIARVLAEDLVAQRTQPPQAMSAMDGYAVRAADATAGATLRVIGEVAAGRPFDRSIGAGEAARVFTGGVIPDGADAVVIQENTHRDGDTMTVTDTATPGRHIRPAGIDFKAGDVLLRAGRWLGDRDLSLIAGMNHPRVPVHRRPRVALLATGDELVMPGTEPAPGQIVYSNGYALRAMMRREGADIIDLGVARDTMEDTVACLRKAAAAEPDILVTTGGASVGDHDLVRHALIAEGIDLAFWRIAMRPGKPMMHGRRDALRVLGLPGNPVSSYVCAHLFVAPLIRALSGRRDVAPRRLAARLGRDLPANDEREDYLRATVIREGGALIATAVTRQDSSLLGHLAMADALLVRAPYAPAAQAGEACEILPLTHEFSDC